MKNNLRRIRSIADYQFGKGIGLILFPKNTSIVCSKATGKIRYLNLSKTRLATLRPTDGFLSLSIAAAKTVAEKPSLARCLVTVQKEVSKFIAQGSDVFAAHIIRVHDDIRAKDEVIVVNSDNQVLAVGRALLSSSEMIAFKTGVAIKVRHGCAKKS